jgi:hypothetical protein
MFTAIRSAKTEVRRGVVLLVALAAFLTVAPAWASAAHPTSRPKAYFSVRPGNLSYLGGRTTLKWSTAHATSCSLSSTPPLWVGRKNPARVRCNGRFAPVLPAADFGGHWTFTFRARDANGKVATVRRALSVRRPPFVVSPNWSGYVVPSTTPVTAVAGTFTIPKLNCRHTKNAGEATWVGTGGSGPSAGELLQTGVRSDCIGGAQDNGAAWWEEYPQVPEIDFNSMSVSAGDSMQASVAQNTDGSWSTRLDDLTTGISGVMTTGQSYGTVLDSTPTVWRDQEGSAASITYTGGYSAEWIVEAFQSNGSLVRLADFGSVAFTGLTTSLSSWGLTGDEQVGLGDAHGYLYAAPSGPDSTNHGFSIKFTG